MQNGNDADDHPKELLSGTRERGRSKVSWIECYFWRLFFKKLKHFDSSPSEIDFTWTDGRDPKVAVVFLALCRTDKRLKRPVSMCQWFTEIFHKLR